MPRGRPTDYNKEIATLICERVATHTCGLKRLCEKYKDMPDKTTVNAWRSKYEEFSTQYAQAKLKQADLLAEECLEIADDATNDYMESMKDDEQGQGWRFNGEHFNRSRLRIDTRKWLAAKLLPKQYGKAAEEQSEQHNHNSVLEKILSGEIQIKKK